MSHLYTRLYMVGAIPLTMISIQRGIWQFASQNFNDGFVPEWISSAFPIFEFLLWNFFAELISLMVDGMCICVEEWEAWGILFVACFPELSHVRLRNGIFQLAGYSYKPLLIIVESLHTAGAWYEFLGINWEISTLWSRVRSLWTGACVHVR